jgi:uncharacterized membrane protein YdjX (TVP38/TMEM64 family)
MGAIVKAKILKGLFGLTWLSLFYLVAFDVTLRNFLYQFCADHRLLAPFALILLQTLFASFGLPCSPLSILAGLLWGFGYGIIYSTAATLVASSFTFILGRYVIKKNVEKIFQLNVLNKIPGLISDHQWKASAVAHANPIFPGSSLGYVFGASEISFSNFFSGVVLGTIPLQLLTVALGNFAGVYLSTESKSIISVLLIIMLIVAYKLFAPKLLKSK